MCAACARCWGAPQVRLKLHQCALGIISYHMTPVSYSCSSTSWLHLTIWAVLVIASHFLLACCKLTNEAIREGTSPENAVQMTHKGTCCLGSKLSLRVLDPECAEC